MNKTFFLIIGFAIFCQHLSAMEYVKNLGSLVSGYEYDIVLGVFSCMRSYKAHYSYKDSFAAMKKCAQKSSDGWDGNKACDMYFRKLNVLDSQYQDLKAKDMEEIRRLVNLYVENGKNLTCYIDTVPTLQNVDDMELGVLRDGKDVAIVLNQLALECLHNKNGFTLAHFESAFIHEAAHINENHSQKKLRIDMAQPIVDLFVSSFAYHISDSYFKLPSYTSILIAGAAYGLSYEAQNLLSLVYARQLERHADAAVFRTKKRNIITDFKDLLEKVATCGEPKNDLSIFSTHPSFNERITSCNQALRELENSSS